MADHAKPPPATDPGRPWKESDLTPDVLTDPPVIPAGLTKEQGDALIADMASRGLTLNNGHWYQGKPLGDPPHVDPPTPEERLDAIEDFLASLPDFSTYGMGRYEGPERAQAINDFNRKHNVIKGRADERQRQRDHDKPDPGTKPGPNDPQ